MKKNILIVLVLSIFLISISNYAQANLLSECHICKVTGKCDKCNGTSTMVCVNCNGTKEMKCDQCNNGDVVCHICNGAKALDCDCKGQSNCPNCFGSKKQICPQCNGDGTLACNSCKGSTTVKCNGCDGIGYVKCDSCKGSEKCISCKGTGYLSGNNNGVNNVPKKGDTVELLSGKTIIWGATSSSGEAKTNKNEIIESSLIQDVNNSELVKKDENKNKDNSQTKENVEKVNAEKENEDDLKTEPDIDTKQNDRTKIIIGENNQNSIAKIDLENMMENEKENFNAVSNNDLEEIVKKLDTIISSAKIGELSENSNEILEEILNKNQLSNKESIKLCKINFDGHISVGFPVDVSVNIDENIFNEEDVILAYHIREDKTIESLGDIQRYCENGKVVRVEFRTRSFSDFFLTTERLDLNLEDIEIIKSEEQLLEQEKINWVYITIIAIIVILTIVILLAVILNTKKQNLK